MEEPSHKISWIIPHNIGGEPLSVSELHHVSFLSIHLVDRVIECALKLERLEAEGFYRQLHVDLIMSTASGWILERMAHTMLSRGGQFNAQPLPWTQDTQHDSHKSFEISAQSALPLRNLAELSTILRFQSGSHQVAPGIIGRYMQPQISNFTTIDSVVVV